MEAAWHKEKGLDYRVPQKYIELYCTRSTVIRSIEKYVWWNDAVKGL